MSDKTHIEWTDATWNPVTGCTKVSAGCKHCYAERDWARLAANPKTRYYGRAFTDVQCHPDVLDLPKRWQRPRRIFVNSMSDLFHPDVPSDFIMAVFCVMAQASQHVFQVLTKRPDRMHHLLTQRVRNMKFPWAPQAGVIPNVALGVSVEDQITADERIPLLLDTPAAVRWISAEPLLGPVKIRNRSMVDWVVVGGESGPRARPMHPDWVRSLRDQCAGDGIPFLFKQWGEWAEYDCGTDMFKGNEITLANTGEVWPRSVNCYEGRVEGRVHMRRVGKQAAGRLLDGKLHDG